MTLDLLPAILWLAPFVVFIRLARRTPQLTDATPATDGLVSVIIPARNEAQNIETVIRSILATSYHPIEVLVVDDRSTDRTAAIVDALAKEDQRVRLIAGEPLPQGWFGKPWACVQGYRQATGNRILFTDADTRHQPALLGYAVGAAMEHQADLLTIAPRQECVTLWERLVMPQIVLILGYRYHPRVVNRARRRRGVIANGQFIFVTRESYEAIGTHAAVKGEVAEDLALAQRFFAAGHRLYLAFAESLMTTRMYRSLGDLIEGWAKNVFLGGRQSFPDEPLRRAILPLLLAPTALFWLIPPVVLALGLAGLLPAWTRAAAAATLLSLGFWGIVSYGMQIPVRYAIGYPLGAAMAAYIFLRSLWRGEKVTWRGREYGVVSRES